MDYQVDASGVESTWVGAFLTDKERDCTHFISGLRFPGRRLRYWPRHSAFVEFYGGKEVHIAQLPAETLVTFFHPRINGRVPRLKKITIHHPTAAPDPASPAIMDAILSEDGNAVVCRMFPRILEQRPTDYTFPVPAHLR